MDFADLGGQCSLASCRQRDFLPFACGLCRGSFCLAHSLPRAHACAAAGAAEHRAVSCPFCGASVHFTGAPEQAHAAFEEHLRQAACGGPPR